VNKRILIRVKGAVQGVGFRPFIYKLATSLELNGYVLNSPQGVVIEAEGSDGKLDEFIRRIRSDKPPISLIQGMNVEELGVNGYTDFEIRKSGTGGQPRALVLPDIATCSDCLKELFDPKDKRYLYPFINCTNCGPRFSIIESLPYDRRLTTMKKFRMCPECEHEYEDPADRRFHAQPNACPVCGPHVELWNAEGKVVALHHEAILLAVNALKEGYIVAVKGIGGFHLMVDALSDDAIARLRRSKNREEKPFALMYPSLSMAESDCFVSEAEKEILVSVQSPIVILRKKEGCRVSSHAAPGNPNLGVMLPYTPLHHIMLRELDSPVVATSGNLSEEPICTDELEALTRLRGIADLFLVNDRPVYRHVDDSIARIVAGDRVLLRRARGYAPMPVMIRSASDKHCLALGGHLKNTIAVSKGDEVFISQHIGDLETSESFRCFSKTIGKFREIYEIDPQVILCDLHPDYISSKYAAENFSNVTPVQHHLAHILSVMAEHDIAGSILGVAWDGAGFGTDKTIWGGEFIRVCRNNWERFAHLKSFRLPGGESAFKDVPKSAFGILYEIYGSDAVQMAVELLDMSMKEAKIFAAMIRQRLNSPVCSGMGRLFDAASAIVLKRKRVSFEGQAAMEMEFLAGATDCSEQYGYEIIDKQGGVKEIDWTLLFTEMIEESRMDKERNIISTKFHNTLAAMIIQIAKLSGENRIALSGGCFQNKYLLERTIEKLSSEGFRVYWNKDVPANDGGISAGQIAYNSYFG
jgi:hydrogenase maturation protein HypF